VKRIVRALLASTVALLVSACSGGVEESDGEQATAPLLAELDPATTTDLSTAEQFAIAIMGWLFPVTAIQLDGYSKGEFTATSTTPGIKEIFDFVIKLLFPIPGTASASVKGLVVLGNLTKACATADSIGALKAGFQKEHDALIAQATAGVTDKSLSAQAVFRLQGLADFMAEGVRRLGLKTDDPSYLCRKDDPFEILVFALNADVTQKFDRNITINAGAIAVAFIPTSKAATMALMKE
jgi:hypothetical protein